MRNGSPAGHIYDYVKSTFISLSTLTRPGPAHQVVRAPGHEPGLGVNYARPRGRGVNGMRE